MAEDRQAQMTEEQRQQAIEAYAQQHGKKPEELTDEQLAQAAGGDLLGDTAAGAGIGAAVTGGDPVGGAVGAAVGAISDLL